MAQQAQITSVEAVESFRAALIVYLAKARTAVDEMSGELVRTKLWLHDTQRRFWEDEHRKRLRKLERLKAELFEAQLSKLQETSAAQQLAVQRAQRTAEEAEDKLKLLRKWERELDNLSDPLIKQIEQLNGFLTTDMVRAVAYLTQIVGTLDAYAAVDKPRAATSDIVTPASDNKGNPSA